MLNKLPKEIEHNLEFGLFLVDCLHNFHQSVLPSKSSKQDRYNVQYEIGPLVLSFLILMTAH